MSKTIVVYHSGYGHTKRVAESVAEGAAAELLAIDAEGNLPEGGWEQLAAADAIIFGTPTYMGGPSWQFKRFADASSKPWYSRASNAWRSRRAARSRICPGRLRGGGGWRTRACVQADKKSIRIGVSSRVLPPSW